MVRVVIADDETLLRSGLRMLLDGTRGLTVVGEAGDGDEAVRVARREAADVVLMDIRMPRRDGLDAARELAADGVAVIMLTAFDTDDFVLQALQAGAAGFLLKDTAPADLVDVVLRAADGDLRVSPTVLRRLVTLASAGREVEKKPTDRPVVSSLTERERAVAAGVGRGLTNAEIATELQVGLATVKTHLININLKLGTTNRVQIALLLNGVRPDPPRS